MSDEAAQDLKTKAFVAAKAPIAAKVEKGKTYYWCTCGKSQNQPFCDGAHVEYSKEVGVEFTPLAWTAEEDGEKYFCACKQTATAPFCDGAHTKLPADEPVEEAPKKPDPFTQEDVDLDAELEKLEAEAHDLETEIAKVDEEAHARDAGEEQIVAEKEHLAAVHKENRALQADIDVLTTQVKDIGDLKRWGEKIKELEKTFLDGNLNSIWQTTCEQVKLDDIKATQTTYIPGKQFDELLRHIENNHELEAARTEEQEVRLEQQKMIIDREKEVALQRLNEEFEMEKAKLEQMRKKLKVVLQEQAFHIKRGTHVKRANVDIKPKDQHIAVEREKEMYNQACARVIEERAKIGVIQSEITTLKETRDHIVKDGEDRQKKAQEALEAAKQEAEDSEWEYKSLVKELEDLRKLRADMIATQTAVKKAVEQ